MSDLAAGKRLRSTACDTEIIVIRPPDTPVELSCGGHPMTAADTARSTPGDPATAERGAVLGKRYVDDATGLEILCTKSGAGPLVADGRQLTIKAAKVLPASD